jgi:hypothetical protein
MKKGVTTGNTAGKAKSMERITRLCLEFRFKRLPDSSRSRRLVRERSGDLTALGTVKHTPYGEILGSVLELMLDPRSHKQQIAGLKRLPFAIVNERSSTANGEVDLVLCVWRLRERAHWERERYIQRTTPKDGNRMLGRRYLRLGLGKTENTTTI